jgi:hypothetical protein
MFPVTGHEPMSGHGLPLEEHTMTCAIIPLLLSSLVLPVSAPGERMYVQNGFQLKTIEPSTGEVLKVTPLLPLISNRGLVFDDGRLYSINQNIFLWRDFLVAVDPATGRWSEVGKTGFSLQSGDVSMVRDPTTGQYYAMFNEAFFEVDKATGTMTFLSRREPEAGINAIAIDSKGRVFGVAAPGFMHSEPGLYRIDLQTGRLALVGYLPPVPILFWTIAFDGQDTLWGAGHGPFTQFEHRLYKIDIDTLELIASFPLKDGAQGIAFGPAPDVEDFCEAKLNSAGCAPAIDWVGHPSATAHYGFEVTCGGVRNQAGGLLIVGLGGRASLPFQGGTLCVAEPWLRTTPVHSGGNPSSTADCSGAWTIDLNSWLFSNQPLPAGAQFACQWWGRDPGFSGRLSGQLSNALEVTLFP